MAMTNRRDFLKTLAAATAGTTLSGWTGGASAFAAAQAPAKRREVLVGGKRAKVVDVHAHCFFPEVADLVKDTKLLPSGGPARGPQVLGLNRLRAMDERGIDMQVLSINLFWWYAAERDLAAQIVKFHNEKLVAWCSTHSDRFVALAPIALQYPDMAAEQLEHAMKELGMRGAAIGGHVLGESPSVAKYDPFWAKAEQLGAMVFMHPGSAENIVKEDGLKGNGDLPNIVGNPLETTVFLSHMIYDGTLDRFPGLKLCAAHGGGYLPSYLGRTDVACDVRPNANCQNKKHPREYFKNQILVDSMVMSNEGLRHLVAETGVAQVVYGTDIPFNWPDSVDLIVNAPYLQDAEKEAILGGNLTKLLKL
jgi:aminocarboxymuconate-semialdehyde decarboxylase